jgi:YDG domain/Bacterial Ig-like domain (group 3)
VPATPVAATAARTSTQRVALVVLQIVAFCLYLIAPMSVLADEPPPAPTIASDKADYAPGELVTLTGANWAASETVTIDVNDDAGKTWRRTVDVVADEAGAIIDQFNLPDWFVATYTVVATSPSASAATSFTDGNVKVSISPGAVTATLAATLYSSANCTGSATTRVVPGTVGVGSSESLRLDAAANGAGGEAFTNWTSDASFSVISGTSGRSICVTGFSSGSRDAVANYAPSAATTITAANRSATYGDPSVTLTATVSPNSVNAGTVTFTVKDGGTTVGSPVTSGTVSGGSASASFPLSGVNAGTYTIEASYSGATGFGSNNNAAQSPAPTLAVGKADTTTTVTCSAGPFTYNGSAHEPCSATVTGPGGLSQSLPVTYTDNVNAGTATASASYAGNANYFGSNDSTTFTIGKASSAVTVSCPASVIYNGSAQTPCTASVTGAGGLSQSLTVNYTDNVNAGTATASAGYSGDANHEPDSDSTTFEIDPVHITGSFTAASKVYDGTVGATVLTRSLSGAILGDSVSLSGGTAAFSDKSVGTGKTVTLTGASLSGADAGNYVLDSVGTTTADITALHITGSFTAANKTYDGGTDATVLARALSGTISGDDVDLDGGTAAFSDKNVGTGKTVTLTGASLSGADAGNYVLDSVATTTANITPKPLTVTGITASDKTWDGNNTAVLNVSGAALVGVISPDVVNLNTASATGTFDGTTVGSHTVQIAGLTISGADAGNYSLVQPATTAAILAWNAQGYGFYQPVGVPNSVFVAAPGALPTPNDATVWNVIKGGQTVPLKFNVFAGTVEKTTLDAITAFSAYKLSACDADAATEWVEFTTTGNTTLRYDGTAGQWIQNWKTPTASRDTCYRASVTFADGSSLTAFFKLRK